MRTPCAHIRDDRWMDGGMNRTTIDRTRMYTLPEDDGKGSSSVATAQPFSKSSLRAVAQLCNGYLSVCLSGCKLD
uniref:Uncharacterized protein n=1 Tax=Panagrellus redivivus TaxID=6233 RepID=A0A7E4ZUI9_PANRE